MGLANGKVVDLRSDTVTRPSAEMRRAMAEAEVGDDVYGEDPTVNRLQDRAAEIFNKEAALFVPSGSMGNLLAVKTWARPGMEVICEEESHIIHHELAAISAVAGCVPRTTPAPCGILTWALIKPLVSPKIYYCAQTGLISLENTHNMHGGTVYPTEVADEICDRAHEAGLPVHLDGARVFNAALALNRSVAEVTRKFDSVMVSLSKGLGAPVGSVLIGPRDFIAQARIGRKLLGGGMRQCGILAAAGLIAFEEGPRGLSRDHENARRLADGLAEIKGICFGQGKVITNIVRFHVPETGPTAAEICAELARENVLCGAFGEFTIRMVTHCDVDRAGIDQALLAAKKVFANPIGRQA